MGTVNPDPKSRSMVIIQLNSLQLKMTDIKESLEKILCQVKIHSKLFTTLQGDIGSVLLLDQVNKLNEFFQVVSTESHSANIKLMAMKEESENLSTELEGLPDSGILQKETTRGIDFALPQSLDKSYDEKNNISAGKKIELDHAESVSPKIIVKKDMFKPTNKNVTCKNKKSKKTYTCHICAKRLKSHATLKRHIEVVHWDHSNMSAETGEVSLSGNSSSYNLEPNSNPKAHIRSANSDVSRESLNCVKIENTENTELETVDEVSMTSEEDEKLNDTFDTDSDNEKAEKGLVHGVENSNRENVKRSKNAKFKYKCPKCDKCYPSATSLKRHKKIVHSNITYDCSKCGSKFKDSFYLAAHMKRHNDETDVKCKHCDKKFSSQLVLNKHIKQSHDVFDIKNSPAVEKDLPVNKEKKGSAETVADQHKGATHIEIEITSLGQKRYKCNEGEKSYPKFSNLKRHQQLVHSNFEPNSKTKAHIRSANSDVSRESLNCVKLENTEMTEIETVDEVTMTSEEEEKLNDTFDTDSDNEKAEKGLVHGVENSNRANVKRSKNAKFKYKCPKCDKCYTSRTSLKRHKKIVHNNITYDCSKCGSKFKDSSYLAAHMKRHNDETDVKCTHCDKKFSSQLVLNKHFKQSHDVFDIKNSPAVDKGSPVKEDEKGSTENADEQDKGATHAEIDITSLGEKRYKCNECEKSYPKIGNLNRHKQVVHTNSTFVCDVCGLCFKAKEYVQKHARIHSEYREKKEYKCSLCPETFHSSGGLKSHLTRHSGERPFQCNKCGRTYISKDNLLMHMKSKHAGVRPYQCDRCPLNFHVPSQLKYHKRTHTDERPYKCSICPASFKRFSVLKDHIYTHTGEKPYECSICKQTFRLKATLKEHQNIHTGKRYPCLGCGQNYSRRGALKVHLKKNEETCGKISHSIQKNIPASEADI